jgi:hypothetical protein
MGAKDTAGDQSADSTDAQTRLGDES